MPSSARPTLTSQTDPIDGDVIDLTCNTTDDSRVTQFAFYKDSQRLALTTNNTYRIPSAEIGRHGGSYTCVVYIDDVVAQESGPLILTGNLVMLKIYYYKS